MEVIYLADWIPWFGAHSGYEMLPRYLEGGPIPSRSYKPLPGLGPRVIGRLASALRGHGRIAQSEAYARTRMELALRLRKDRIGHLLYGEEHLLFWRDVPAPLLERSVLTLHQPPSFWSESWANSLSCYRHLIVLWQKDAAWFQSKMRNGTIRFIHHGVDTAFFTPAPEAFTPSSPMHLLYAGIHLRNTPMLGRIIRELSRRRSDVHFDLLVPEHRRQEPGFAELQNHPHITWHAGLNDEQLRELYRRAHLLLLPMNDSGANTSVVEALACGLPIVTTDVGGIRDYGGDDFYPVVKNDDDDGMLALIEDYLSHPTRRAEVSMKSREFAENVLAWPLIAQKHVAVYREVLG
jgi:glycosyltransferase involved in cell wall biosynthesis